MNPIYDFISNYQILKVFILMLQIIQNSSACMYLLLWISVQLCEQGCDHLGSWCFSATHPGSDNVSMGPNIE